MTTNFNTNHQIMKMKTKVNCPKIAKETSSGSTLLFPNHQIMKMKTKVNRPKIAKETSSGSTRLFQRTSPTASVNISFF